MSSCPHAVTPDPAGWFSPGQARANRAAVGLAAVSRPSSGLRSLAGLPLNLPIVGRPVDPVGSVRTVGRNGRGAPWRHASSTRGACGSPR
jgi:hypothetical protein